jgi:hypothetical protein
MRIHEVEAWTLDVVDRLRAGARVEDARVEIKSDLTKPADAARKLEWLSDSTGQPIRSVHQGGVEQHATYALAAFVADAL